MGERTRSPEPARLAATRGNRKKGGRTATRCAVDFGPAAAGGLGRRRRLGPSPEAWAVAGGFRRRQGYGPQDGGQALDFGLYFSRKWARMSDEVTE